MNVLKKYYLMFLLVIGVSATSCDPAALQAILAQSGNSILSNETIARALKQALDKGVNQGVSYLGQTGGFSNTAYKILLPKEAQTVAEKLRIIPGFNQVEQVIIEKINKSAEDAVKKASPIFISAIKQMTIRDAMNILMGEKNAATQYLNHSTYNALYSEFEPVVVNSLNKFGALDYWTKAVTSYNQIPFIKKLDPKLENFIVQKSLEALFDRIEKEELNIRNNISARTTDLMRQVFAKQDA